MKDRCLGTFFLIKGFYSFVFDHFFGGRDCVCFFFEFFCSFLGVHFFGWVGGRFGVLLGFFLI